MAPQVVWAKRENNTTLSEEDIQAQISQLTEHTCGG